MPRACTVCQHDQRDAIDRALAAGAVNRRIAAQYGLAETSVRRHHAEHLPAAMVQGEQVKAAAQSIDLMGELQACLARVRLLFDACDRWLRDADDPTRYDIGPRATDLAVTYWEATPDGAPVRRKATLAELLDRVAGVAPDVRLVETKSADPRELVLHTAKRLEGHLALVGQLMGKLQPAGTTVTVITASPEWAAIRAALVAALAPFPDARVQVAAALAALESAPLPAAQPTLTGGGRVALH